MKVSIKASLLFTILCILNFSCKLNPNSSPNYSDSQVFNLTLKPRAGTQYYYTITNTTDVKIKYNEKDVHNENVTTVGLIYTVYTDTGHTLQIGLKYDLIQLHSENGDHESNLDASNASFSSNPTERMLGALKNAEVILTTDKQGHFKVTKGYEELSSRLLGLLDSTDLAARTIAQNQLDRTIRDGLIQNSLDQLFKIFPDSAVRRGEKWKIFSKPSAEFPLNATTYYTLQTINENIAMQSGTAFHLVIRIGFKPMTHSLEGCGSFLF